MLRLQRLLDGTRLPLQCYRVRFGGHRLNELRSKAVQVDPITPTLKAPVTQCLKLKRDEPPSKNHFKFNLRRYCAACNNASRASRTYYTSTYGSSNVQYQCSACKAGSQLFAYYSGYQCQQTCDRATEYRRFSSDVFCSKKLTAGQGLTLVHFPAQPKPFYPLKDTAFTLRTPQIELTSSRKMGRV